MEPEPTPAADAAGGNSDNAQESGNVIPFRPRPSRAADIIGQEAGSSGSPGPQDLAKYERGDGEDDYRHRMITNAAALLFTIVLAGAGAWLAITIGDMRKNQDCVLSGRRNCSPIEVPASPPDK
jgi:hypothetical protein